MRKNYGAQFVLIIFGIVVSAPSVFAKESSFLKSVDWIHPVPYIIISAILLIVLAVIAIMRNNKTSENGKKILFWLMVIPVVFSTLYLAGYTVYENVVSESGGPVHWHLDYQVWACGERLDLINPDFPRNKIGTPLFHEHDDDRIHTEGTVPHLADVDLGSYFETIGGKLAQGELVYNTEDNGLLEFKDGDLCEDGSVGSLKVYVNGELMDDFENYLYYPDPLVPPGDCAIILFDDTNAQTTDVICESWEVAGWSYDNYKEQRRDVSIGDYSWE